TLRSVFVPLRQPLVPEAAANHTHRLDARPLARGLLRSWRISGGMAVETPQRTRRRFANRRSRARGGGRRGRGGGRRRLRADRSALRIWAHAATAPVPRSG